MSGKTKHSTCLGGISQTHRRTAAIDFHRCRAKYYLRRIFLEPSATARYPNSTIHSYNLYYGGWRYGTSDEEETARDADGRHRLVCTTTDLPALSPSLPQSGNRRQRMLPENSASSDAVGCADPEYRGVRHFSSSTTHLAQEHHIVTCRSFVRIP
ncbi:hypothetical protein CONLIGDRAFT_627745 [Coniochaeta ligniaria NRRL 30616]|uniref:Uncharacterized protein n=1 Tax=Coniochaeta ligniaria NRRL 30616 TaxID=1408157 RepID=A0A1J7K625_9PEZI|nr:hypothetical protein CONLIGDRAFT_627745 [Coniochaeta ligniaria NRRL 30616]